MLTNYITYALTIDMVLLALYFLFKDSMNLFQKVGRLYWITRNDLPGQPLVSRAFLKQVAIKDDLPEYWYGRGVQFRFRKWTFQVGWLQGTKKTMEEQISNIGWLDVDPKTLRKEWGNASTQQADSES